MPANVPTMDEFNALDARVTALENGNVNPPDPTPPDPTPPDPTPDPGNGIQAKRIVNLFKFGVNTFSSMDQNNVWGSWPADYRPDTVIKALQWIVQDTGHVVGIREYHYKGRESWQKPWLAQIKTAFPDMQNIMCVGANGSANDVASMVAMQKDASTGVVWIEGLNEPNTNFGSGEVAFPVTKAIQDNVWSSGTRGSLLGPSIVAGTPHPEGWITGYCGTQANLDALNAAMDIGNGHYYPPGSPDVPSTGYSVNDYIGGLWGAYAKHPISLTEFHPTLYNSAGFKPDQPGWLGARDAYYTLTTLFRVGQNGTHSLWWYALFDYGTVYKCGLFPTNDQNPREDAFGLRALCSICADRGDKRRTFDPGKLAFTVLGGDANTTTDLYQGSNGVFYIALWRSLDQAGGTPINVSFNFPSKPSKIEEFNISKLAADKQTNNYASTQVNTSKDGNFTSRLDASARILRITV